MTQQRTDEKKRRTRMCLATRTVLPESALMRFVVSPDDVVVPDLKAKLPGRGAWVRATRADLSDAIARKLLSRALKTNAAIGDQLPDDVARLLKKAALGRLGLARKAGDVVTGFTKTASALASGNALVLITASDGAPDGRRKIMAVRTRTAGDDAPVAHIDKIAGPELDLALGASNVIHAAVLQGSAGRSFQDAAQKLLRYEGWLETENGLPADPGQPLTEEEKRQAGRAMDNGAIQAGDDVITKTSTDARDDCMSDTGKDDGTIRVEQRRTLSLKRDTGTVRQSFSGGRSKSVVVEKKRRRVLTPGGETAAPAADAAPVVKAPVAAPAATPATPPVAKGSASSAVLRTLTAGEQDARAHALAEAKVREAEEHVQAEADAKRRSEENARLELERADSAARQAAEDAHNKVEAAARAEEEARQLAGEPVPAKPGAGADEEKKTIRAVVRQKRPDPKPAKRSAGERRRGRLTVTNALDDNSRERSLAAVRRRREKEKRQQAGFSPSNEKIVRDVIIPEAISVQDLANRMAERAVDVIRLLMKQGNMVKMTDILDADTAQLVAEEMGHAVRRVAAADVEAGLFDQPDEDGELTQRPPVVTIMGHVDHGKTSLLDAIRQANVVSGEAGGITQHIGAYQVDLDGKKVTFIDTPGHAAFTAMRARGAQATDIVILVVAADDGVMPQTVEAINHAREAGVPIIVAINKIDRRDADPMRVKTDLLQHEIVTESMSGEVQEVEVSATEKTNLDGLLEAILLQAEILELKANADRPAEGTVIEAQLDRGRGAVATVLVQRGTLRIGDIVVAGSEWGRVRALVDDKGNQLPEAGPSLPVEVLGFSEHAGCRRPGCGH